MSKKKLIVLISLLIDTWINTDSTPKGAKYN